MIGYDTDTDWKERQTKAKCFYTNKWVFVSNFLVTEIIQDLS